MGDREILALLGYGQYAGRQEILDLEDKGMTDITMIVDVPFVQEH